VKDLRMKLMEKNKKYWNPIIETLPRERLIEIELRRFREICRWAKENSPFYKRKLYGIEPEDIRTLEDVAKGFPLRRKMNSERRKRGKSLTFMATCWPFLLRGYLYSIRPPGRRGGLSTSRILMRAGNGS
jgi:phenylacetate-coenzyme A ligase PaaK-like adenylate-forming protein